MLVGHAVIVGLLDPDGNATDVPHQVVDLLMDDGEYVVLVKVGGIPDSISTRRFSSILLPLGHGDPSWCVSCTRYEGYLAAVAWALVFLERWSDAMKTEVVRVSRLEYHLRNVIDALPE